MREILALLQNIAPVVSATILEQMSQVIYGMLIFLESPHRIVDSLEDTLSVLGDRRICVAREMTKLFEEFWRGPVSGAIEHFKSKEPRGEFTLVIEGKKTEDCGRLTEEELKKDRSAKEISSELAEKSGWNKKVICNLANQNKGK